MDEDLDPWPTEQEILDFYADMAARPVEIPSAEEIEAMVEAWLEYHERHLKIVDDYHAALRSRGFPRPPF